MNELTQEQKRVREVGGMTRQQFEVRWYRKHGRHPNRIRREHGGRGDQYVIGDWSWHRIPDAPDESIELAMDIAWNRFVARALTSPPVAASL